MDTSAAMELVTSGKVTTLRVRGRSYPRLGAIA
jgi:hypothetical protein